MLPLIRFRGPQVRRVTTVVLFLVALATAPSVQAEGGAAISGAPGVAYGQQDFGYLHFVKVDDCRQWWVLPTVAGDHLQIDWEVQDPYIELRLYALGTSDFNFLQTSARANGGVNSNLKAEFTYVSEETGGLPMLFTDPGCYGNAEPGPYNFTAYVTHSLVVGSPNASVLHAKGVLAVPVHDPAGGEINDPAVTCALEIKSHGQWTTIGTAPVASSLATIRFAVPARLRHEHVNVRAVAKGAGYFTASSSARKARAL
jgi:hypothetical protein